jgi:16S rRNA G966 N2-methylase RsmD
MKINKTIELINTERLIPYPRNSRTHSDAQLDQIAASIREFGFTNPVLIDAENEIIAGHGRILAAKILGLEEVPCIRIDYLSDAQKRALILADNKLALNAGWDDDLLTVELGGLRDIGFEIGLTGFGEDELNLLLSENHGDHVNDKDVVPEPPKTPITTYGDVWRLGEHRLLCGDSSRDRSQFLDGVEPDLCFIDPPYEIADAWNWIVDAPKALVFTDHKHIREAMDIVLKYPVQYQFIWDTVISWYTQNRPLCRHRSAFYCAQNDGWNSDAATFIDDKERKEKIVVGGQAFAGDYHYKPLSGGRVRVTSLYRQSKTLDEAGNGKPVAWVRALLAGAEAREVFEPFGGTGATIIAAPAGCVVHSIEIDPCKVDSIVARWEAATGLEAFRE